MNFENRVFKKWLVVANPAAGNGKVRMRWEEIRRLLMAHDFDFEVAFTEHKGHALQLTREGIERGFRKIMAVGGDGTGNEVVNGIFTQKTCLPTDVLFTLLSIGTGNDWIKTHKIPKEIDRWLPLIKKEKTAFQDIGLVHYSENGKARTHYFFNVAGLAYDGFVGKMITARSAKMTNKFFYLMNIARWLFQYRLRKAHIAFNDREITDSFYSINVGICRYSAGGMIFVPHAVPNDGQFALTITGKASKLSVLLATPLFYNGKIHWHPAVSLHSTKHIKVEAMEDRPTYLEVDGEFLGETPVEFEIIEKGLKMVCP